MPASGTTATLPPALAEPLPAAVEDGIGELLIAIADLSVRAMAEHQEDGRLTGPTTRQAGAMVARLYELRQVLGSTVFSSSMHRQAQLRLRQRHGVALSAATAAAVADEVLAIVAQVDATMRARAH